MAQATLQRYIDAQQDVDAIVYGQRAIGPRGTAFKGTVLCVGWAQRQWLAAREVAQRVLGEPVVYDPCYGAFKAKSTLKRALAVAREELAEAKAELKAIGGKRQLRLALTEQGEAREMIAAAEARGFVREPSLAEAYEDYLLTDAEEAREFLAEAA